MTERLPAPDFGELCADLLAAGRPVRFRARGPSMSPAILDGESLTVAPVRPGEIVPGDVILYRSPRGLTVHRVVTSLSGEPLAWRVQGDAPGSEEERGAAGQLLGRVETVRREGRDQPVGRRAVSRAAFLRRLLPRSG
jgi:hypothetical protein